MKNKVVWAALAVLISTAIVVGQVAITYTFPTISAVGASAIYTPGGAPLAHTFDATVTGSPASCTIQYEGSNKAAPVAADMRDLSGPITCTSDVMIHIVNKPITALRINVTALSGGATVSVRYLGIR